MTSRFSPFTETLWYATAALAPKTTALEGRIQAEVCLFGAGYTGRTTALVGIGSLVTYAPSLGE